MEKLILDRFNDKTIIFSGIANELCHKAALTAAKEGARIILIGSDEAIKGIANDIKVFSPRVEIYTEELYSYSSCKNLIELAKRVFGSVDILVGDPDTIFNAVELTDSVTSAISSKTGGALIAVSKEKVSENRLKGMSDKYSLENIVVNELITSDSVERTADTILYLASDKGRCYNGKIIEADESIGQV